MTLFVLHDCRPRILRPEGTPEAALVAETVSAFGFLTLATGDAAELEELRALILAGRVSIVPEL